MPEHQMMVRELFYQFSVKAHNQLLITQPRMKDLWDLMQHARKNDNQVDISVRVLEDMSSRVWNNLSMAYEFPVNEGMPLLSLFMLYYSHGPKALEADYARLKMGEDWLFDDKTERRTRESTMRALALRVITLRHFDNLVLLAIVANCVFMALDDPLCDALDSNGNTCTLSCTVMKVKGHNYIGHNYIGHNCIGHARL